MGRRSERLSKDGPGIGDGDVIQVVSRAFDVLRCFDGHDARLGNLDIASRCGLPRSTVSRLTHTLTRMGQLVYLPNDQKYRIGPSAVAMSTAMLRGLHLRNLIRARLEEVAATIPGTVGFVVPDRFHLVYLEYARASNAIGLSSVTGTRIAIALTAAGHAYTAALDPDVADALIRDIAREAPDDAKVLRARIDDNRKALAQNGYVTACGLWSPHINGIALPLWSPQYNTFVVITIGLLAPMYDERRLHAEVAQPLLALGRSVATIIEAAEGRFDDGRARPANSPYRHQSTSEVTHELEAGTGRTRPARNLRKGDGRR